MIFKKVHIQGAGNGDSITYSCDPVDRSRAQLKRSIMIKEIFYKGSRQSGFSKLIFNLPMPVGKKTITEPIPEAHHKP